MIARRTTNDDGMYIARGSRLSERTNWLFSRVEKETRGKEVISI
jgi:hypothetical protein